MASCKPMIRAIALVLLLVAFPARADVSGKARVIDGDTIEVAGQRIRLHGIDAPESGQACEVDGKAWQCGQAATRALSRAIGAHSVTCEERDRDRYKRIVAVCSVGNRDLGALMVSEGFALAYRRYSTDYVKAEDTARKTQRGMWAGRFIEPWSWRRGQRLASEAANDNQACNIKGNISRNGRIYHMPGGAYYERTRIDEAKGERWFCSEAEARAAGWRRSKR